MHAMRLRVTVDGHFNVVEAVAVSDSVPYPGYCEAIVGDYDKLVGLNLVRGFRAGLRERLGERDGCTHLTELAQSLPTAAVQAFAGDQRRHQEMERQANGHGQRPFQIDRCHALRSDGPAVERYYPAWFRQTAKHVGAFDERAPAAGERDGAPAGPTPAHDSAASKEEQP